LKKIIILAYFFPPSNFVGSERIDSWAKHMNQFDYYPIIITRQWNKGQTDLVDFIQKNNLEVDKFENYEVHRLPYKRSFRDICSNYKWLKLVQKTLTLFEIIFSNYLISAIPFSNFYKYTSDILKNNSDINVLIASGRPFQLFSIGSKLKKKHPKIHWIPDYRDEWNSFKRMNNEENFLTKFIQKLEQKSELKWTSNATAFISVGKKWVEEIEDYISKKGIIIYNGFDEIQSSQFELVSKTSLDELVITYTGTLYDNQPIEKVIQVLKEFNISYPEIKLTVNFVGIELNYGTYNRVLKLINSNQDFFKVYPRMSKSDLAKIYENSDLLLITKYENIEGITPVKLFDYYASAIPLLLYPSDHNAMEEFINKTNSGYVLNDNNTVDDLKRLYDIKFKNLTLKKERNKEFAESFTKKNQIKLLAEYLDTLV